MSQLYNDLVEGLQAAERYLKGEITLPVTVLERPEIAPDEIKSIRQTLNLTQEIFARKLRTSVRTYQGWEQGKSRPNPQATLLLRMVQKNPQTFDEIAQL